MMLEFSFWKTAPPQTTNGIYELRKYNLKVIVTVTILNGGHSTYFVARSSPVTCSNGNIIGICLRTVGKISALSYPFFFIYIGERV